MLCYSCFEQGTERPAVALCRSCNAGLCMDHLRATAAHFATSHMLDSCHHDTWTAPARGAHNRGGVLTVMADAIAVDPRGHATGAQHP